MRTALVTLTMCLLALPANARYSGGTGEPNDPYQIATAADLIALGEDPNGYGKHFILTADIDLDPNLPGRRVFDRAVIAPDVNDTAYGYQGPAFTGFFDGNRHVIRNLRIQGGECLGLFGYADRGAKISNLGLEAVDVNGTGDCAGGLVGENYGSITTCYSTATVNGCRLVGGLVGYNSGSITNCHSSGAVSGTGMWASVGGLVGANWGSIANCHSSGTVIDPGYFSPETSYGSNVGGLAGSNLGSITNCYSSGTASGGICRGGLVGYNFGSITNCHTSSTVIDTGHYYGDTFYGGYAGGLVGGNSGRITSSFWDIQTSGQQSSSGGGTGLTTAEMQTASTFLAAGWDFVGETANGPNDVWKIVEGLTYPLLSWQKYSGGTGEPNDPYQIATATDLIALGEDPNDYDKHFILIADIDLDPNLPGRRVFDRAVIAPDVWADDLGWYQGPAFTGFFDGNRHVIRNLHIQAGDDYIGLFGQAGPEARISNLSLEAVDVNGYSIVGGLVGENCGRITTCCSSGTVSGHGYGYSVGGLVGVNDRNGSITNCFSSGAVNGSAGYSFIDGLGGLVGGNSGSITNCYSSGSVEGQYHVGGLVGNNYGSIVSSFWDVDASGTKVSDGGVGLTTAEMQTVDPFLKAGWDFVGETGNGTEDVWTICAGRGYPRLAWEQVDCADPNLPAKTVFYPDYVTLATYGTRTFQWTYGRIGEWTSEVVGTVTVNYGDGSCRTATEISNTSFSQGKFWNEAAYNDGITTGMVALGDFWLSADPDLTGYPPAWSFGAVTDGMRVDMSPYYLIRKDGTQPPARMDFRVNLYTVQDVNVLCGHYADALVLWSLDTRYPYVPLDFAGKEADLGLELPTASDTAGCAVIGFRIRGWHADLLAMGGVDPQTGRLLYLGELKEIKAP
jgi:hypothetical protein